MKYVEEKPLEIFFEDNHLLIVNKPADLLTQPTNLQKESLEGLAKAYIKGRYKKPGNVFLHALHRLDKPVSGIVVFAKTSKALRRLNQQIREGLWQKTYLATLESPMNERQGELIDYILHKDFHAKIVPKETPGAKKAHLHYKTLDDGQVEINLITGRYHQIRAQFAHRSCPIKRDRKYGAKTSTNSGAGIELKHSRLQLEHPCDHNCLIIQNIALQG